MEGIVEYSNICDIVSEIGKLNINDQYTEKKQENLISKINSDDLENVSQKEIEQYEEFKLHYDNKYNDFKKLMDFDLMEYIIPMTSFLTNKLNEFLLNTMFEYTSLNEPIKDQNIINVIEYYHFCLNFTNKYYRFQSKLGELDKIMDKTERKEYLNYARKEMKKIFSYSKLEEINEFIKYCKQDIIFDVKNKTYHNLENHKKIYLKQSYYLINELEELVKTNIEFGTDFDIIKARDKLQIIKPFHNLMQFFLLIVMK